MHPLNEENQCITCVISRARLNTVSHAILSSMNKFVDQYSSWYNFWNTLNQTQTIYAILTIYFFVFIFIYMCFLVLGRVMGQGGDGFYLPRLHIPYSQILTCYPYPTGMRNWISSPSPTGSGIPVSSPFPQWIIFFNKNKSIFRSRSQFCNELSRIEMMTINGYGDREARGRECEIWKEIWENYDR
jgi:hypothetical protein